MPTFSQKLSYPYLQSKTMKSVCKNLFVENLSQCNMIRFPSVTSFLSLKRKKSILFNQPSFFCDTQQQILMQGSGYKAFLGFEKHVHSRLVTVWCLFLHSGVKISLSFRNISKWTLYPKTQMLFVSHMSLNSFAQMKQCLNMLSITIKTDKISTQLWVI